METEIYEALNAAGAPDDKARAAASAIAGFNARIEERLDRIEIKMVGVEQRLEVIESDLRVFRNDVAGIEIDVGEIRAKIGAIQWVLGGVGVIALVLLIKSFWSV